MRRFYALVLRLEATLAGAFLLLMVLLIFAGGVSGSAIADAAMQARMLGEAMVARGFTRGFAAAVLSFGAVLTPIIPPGIGMILYGSIGQVSIGRLFAAGFFPAFLLWLGLSAAVWLTARRAASPERSRPISSISPTSCSAPAAWSRPRPPIPRTRRRQRPTSSPNSTAAGCR